MDRNIAFAIITCSDTRGMKEDTAGAALETLIAENGWECKSHVVVPDERPFIASAIVRACDEQDVDVVLTCGGSGKRGIVYAKMPGNHMLTGHQKGV